MKTDSMSPILRKLSERFGDVPKPLWLQQAGYLELLVGFTFAYTAWNLIHALYLSPLKHIPGPLSARLTAKRGLWYVITGKAAEVAKSDYETWGDVYMSKPNAVFLCDPEDARTVLAMSEFRKTDMYRIFEYEGVSNVATFTDPTEANRRRRQLHPFFAYSYLAKMESDILDYGISALKSRWNKMMSANEIKGERTIVNYRLDTQLAMFDSTLHCRRM